MNVSDIEPSVRAVGLGTDNQTGEGNKLNPATGDIRPKACLNIWGSAQGVCAVHAVTTTADYVDRLEREYHAVKDALCA